MKKHVENKFQSALPNPILIRPVDKMFKKPQERALPELLSPLAHQNLEALYSEVQMSLLKGFISGELSGKMRAVDPYTSPRFIKYLTNPFSAGPLARERFIGKRGNRMTERELGEIMPEFVCSYHFGILLDHLFNRVMPALKDNNKWVRQIDWARTSVHFIRPDGQEEIRARHKNPAVDSFSGI